MSGLKPEPSGNKKTIMRILPLALYAFALLASPATAYAAAGDPSPQGPLALAGVQVWALLAGALMPLGVYVLNHAAPWADEKVKAVVQVVLAAVAGGIAQAIDTGGVGWNDATLELVLTSVVAALFAHGFLFKPAGINTALGGGRNVQDAPRR